MTFIAGAYTCTLGGSSVGQIEAGITLEHQHFARIITGDNFAETPQDSVFRGIAMFVQYTLLEYNAAAVAEAMWPYGTGFLNMSQPVGVLAQDEASQLVMTSTANTPAAAAPASATFPKVIIAEGFPVSLLFAPDLRTVPIRQRIFPNTSGVFGTTT